MKTSWKEMLRARSWKLFSTFVIDGQDGSPYLVRHTILSTPCVSVMLHVFLRSDADTCFHDHPWSFASIVIDGEYEEHTPTGIIHRKRGSIAWRHAEHRHRVCVSEPCTTIIIRGPRKREWGFWTRSGWIRWDTFLNRKAAGEDLCP